jgi:hypothetical protein
MTQEEIRKQVAKALAILYAARVGADELREQLRHQTIAIAAIKNNLNQINGYCVADEIHEAIDIIEHLFNALGGTEDELSKTQSEICEELMASFPRESK